MDDVPTFIGLGTACASIAAALSLSIKFGPETSAAKTITAVAGSLAFAFALQRCDRWVQEQERTGSHRKDNEDKIELGRDPPAEQSEEQDNETEGLLPPSERERGNDPLSLDGAVSFGRSLLRRLVGGGLPTMALRSLLHGLAVAALGFGILALFAGATSAAACKGWLASEEFEATEGHSETLSSVPVAVRRAFREISFTPHDSVRGIRRNSQTFATLPATGRTIFYGSMRPFFPQEEYTVSILATNLHDPGVSTLLNITDPITGDDRLGMWTPADDTACFTYPSSKERDSFACTDGETVHDVSDYPYSEPNKFGFSPKTSIMAYGGTMWVMCWDCDSSSKQIDFGARKTWDGRTCHQTTVHEIHPRTMNITFRSSYYQCNTPTRCEPSPSPYIASVVLSGLAVFIASYTVWRRKGAAIPSMPFTAYAGSTIIASGLIPLIPDVVTHEGHVQDNQMHDLQCLWFILSGIGLLITGCLSPHPNASMHDRGSWCRCFFLSPVWDPLTRKACSTVGSVAVVTGLTTAMFSEYAVQNPIYAFLSLFLVHGSTGRLTRSWEMILPALAAFFMGMPFSMVGAVLVLTAMMNKLRFSMLCFQAGCTVYVVGIYAPLLRKAEFDFEFVLFRIVMLVPLVVLDMMTEYSILPLVLVMAAISIDTLVGVIASLELVFEILGHTVSVLAAALIIAAAVFMLRVMYYFVLMRRARLRAAVVDRREGEQLTTQQKENPEQECHQVESLTDGTNTNSPELFSHELGYSSELGK